MMAKSYDGFMMPPPQGEVPPKAEGVVFLPFRGRWPSGARSEGVAAGDEALAPLSPQIGNISDA